LTLEVQGKRQELQLDRGLVWRRQGTARWLVGALEIPESGVKLTQGDVLRFSGNMPPSLKGAMTLKVPLVPIQGVTEAERFA